MKYVKGDTELINKLRELRRTHVKAAVRKGSREGSKLLAATARELAPVKTGAMRNAIKVRALKRSRKWVGAQVTMNNTATYYYSFVEFGTKKMSAKEFLRNAAKQSGEQAADKAIEIIQVEIEKRLRQ